MLTFCCRTKKPEFTCLFMKASDLQLLSFDSALLITLNEEQQKITQNLRVSLKVTKRQTRNGASNCWLGDNISSSLLYLIEPGNEVDIFQVS